VEITDDCGVGDTGDARGAAYADFNRDGFLDFAVINNNATGGGDGSDGLPRTFHVNQGNGTFRDVARSWGLRLEQDAEPVQGRVDLSGNRWIQIRPRGTETNLDAVGARITVRAGGKTWIQDVGASSYLSHNSSYRHFGLGNVAIIDEIQVRFPGGKTVAVENVATNQFLTLSDDLVPVRLLAFDVAAAGEGVRVGWRYADDGDAAFFTLRRTARGEDTVVAEDLLARGGEMSVLDREAPVGDLVYTLEARYRDGSREVVRVQSFRHQGPPVVLGRGTPNPFRAATSIPLVGAGRSGLLIDILDVNGRRLRSLPVAAGAGSVVWDGRDASGRDVPAGIYFYRLVGDGETLQSLKLVRTP
jgi:hypothetical protein